MKICIRKRLLPPALAVVIGLMPAGRVTAQTFTTLHTFTNSPDGAGPVARLVLSGGTLYGTAADGGTGDSGTVFALNTDGTGYTNLYCFTAGAFDYSLGTKTNGDGAEPGTGLVLSGDTLYGTTSSGGVLGYGTVFAINTNGTGFRVLQYNDSPTGGLIISGNTLYWTAFNDGSSDDGAIFAIDTSGAGFTNVYSFSGGSNGVNPESALLLAGGILYGVAGGGVGGGPVFAVNTNGSGFTNLYGFSSTNGTPVDPNGSLILSGDTLYGTTANGGDAAAGTVFALDTNGTDFTNLYTFTVDSDAGNPEGGLVLSGNTLYGTTTYLNGTVFGVNTSGAGYTNLHSFTAGSDGAEPSGQLILSGNTLYGTTSRGGANEVGTVFSISLPAQPPPPQLTIILSGANVILLWPTNATGFTLQSATNLIPPVAWSAVNPAPVVVNTNYAVTNAISGTQRFYRLSQ